MKTRWILDPFCGCGTTVSVAERLKRKWVGIDISMLAINIIAKRLKQHYPYIRTKIDGIPMDYEGAQQLADKDKYAFQDWAISLIGANPPSGESKKGADRGIDGLILFYERVSFTDPRPVLRKIIVQVKGGATGRGDIAKLKGDMERENSPMGVLITLQEPTTEMKREASLAGEHKYSEAVSFPENSNLIYSRLVQRQNVETSLRNSKPIQESRSENRATCLILDQGITPVRKIVLLRHGFTRPFSLLFPLFNYEIESVVSPLLLERHYFDI